MYLRLCCVFLSLSCASGAQTAPSQTPPTSGAQQAAQPAVQEQATQTDFSRLHRLLHLRKMRRPLAPPEMQVPRRRNLM